MDSSPKPCMSPGAWLLWVGFQWTGQRQRIVDTKMESGVTEEARKEELNSYHRHLAKEPGLPAGERNSPILC